MGRGCMADLIRNDNNVVTLRRRSAAMINSTIPARIRICPTIAMARAMRFFCALFCVRALVLSLAFITSLVPHRGVPDYAGE